MEDFNFGFGDDFGFESDNYSLMDVVNSLTIDDVERFLRSLGVETIDRIGNKELHLPTICHNRLDEAENMKLYWYQNSKLFHCYTECSDNITIFELYQKFCKLNQGIEVNFHDAVEYVKGYILHLTTSTTHYERSLLLNKDKCQSKHQLIENFKTYPETILERFLDYHHAQWRQEGITDAAMDKFGIKFWIQKNQIIIPHRDYQGNLIGIRCREMNEDYQEFGAKYHPILLNSGMLCNHPVTQNLYGSFEHGKALRTYHRAIVVEGEKSCMLDESYNGEDSLTVACCGHNLGIYQVNLLTKVLGVNEITLAFDKEYDNWEDSDAKKDWALLQKICNKYNSHAKFSFIWDYDNLLEHKDSPFDKGKEVWEKLYKERVRVK